MIDLDDSNIAEMDGDTEKMKGIFNPILILQYSFESVDFKKLSQIHMRGNSRKNSIDVKNYLVMFFKHEDVLYSWTQFQENQKPDENCALYKVCQLSKFMFFTLDNKSFLFLQDEQGNDGNVSK